MGPLGLEREGVWVGWVSSVDGEGVARGEETRGHGEAHYADSDPSDSGLRGFDWVWVWCSHVFPVEDKSQRARVCFGRNP